MPVTYIASLRTDRLRLVLNDLGTATAPTISTTGTLAGSLVIGTSALSGATGVLATVTLPTTPASVTGDVLTLLGVPLTATASATGTAAKAELRDNAGNAIVTGLTVTASGGGGDVIISSVAITSGQTIQVNSGTITHPV